MQKKQIAIIGSGPAALMLACQLNTNKFNVSIYEKNTAIARKFLVAGQGGFNLTHSELPEEFIKKYSPSNFIYPAFNLFNNLHLRTWLNEKKIETYVGTSKRVFPVKGIKPIHVLNAFENELKNKNVKIFTNYKWLGWNNNDDLIFNVAEEQKIIKADVCVFALGGATWRVTGSDGNWFSIFLKRGIDCNNFIPSNCAYKVDWGNALNEIEGQALKNCVFSIAGQSKMGEAVITKFGIEGGAIYFLSKAIRESLRKNNTAEVKIDFKPNLSEEEIFNLLNAKANKSIKDVLEDKLKLSPAQIALLKSRTNKLDYNNPKLLANLIKSFTIKILDFGNLDDAISSVGGIDLNELDENFQLKNIENQYCIGEMLDWDAPTGGYLLQACFSMGNYLATHLNSI